jgi:hypothetical protein
MWAYLIAIAGLTALCAAWVLFQQWIARVDPEQGDCAVRRGQTFAGTVAMIP